MILRIEEGIDIPIYQQIRNQIVYGISSGELAAGEQLPTVRALAAEYLRVEADRAVVVRSPSESSVLRPSYDTPPVSM